MRVSQKRDSETDPAEGKLGNRSENHGLTCKAWPSGEKLGARALQADDAYTSVLPYGPVRL